MNEDFEGEPLDIEFWDVLRGPTEGRPERLWLVLEAIVEVAPQHTRIKELAFMNSNHLDGVVVSLITKLTLEQRQAVHLAVKMRMEVDNKGRRLSFKVYDLTKKLV